MSVNDFMQIVVIIVSSIVLYYRVVDKSNLKTFANWYGAFLQGFLIFLYIRELSTSDLSYKKWYWFVVDFLLIFYFFLRIIKNDKIHTPTS